MSAASRCRVCGGHDLEDFLSLGEMPLPNALLTEKDLEHAEARYPLDLAFCPDCTLVQLRDTVPPEVLFDEYLYFSSFVDALVTSADTLSSRLITERSLGPDNLVVEVGSNDGYLLRHYVERGIRARGVDPARNVARVAEEHGVPTTCAYFGRELGAQLRDELGQALVLHAHNVVAHVQDAPGFAAGMATLLAADGVAVVELPYIRELVDQCAFDTIYHEHPCYFSLQAMDHLFSGAGLGIESVERIALHGGSLRLFLTKGAHGRMGPSAIRLLQEERECGLDTLEYYRDFARKVDDRPESLIDTLGRLRDGGYRVAGYGAGAKAGMLLNLARLGPESLAFIVDRSTHKQGLFMPGVRVPIRAPAELLTEMPDFVVIFAWSLADEVIAQQGEYLRRGGRFVVLVPEVRIVTAEGSLTLGEALQMAAG